jgi:hypothetical protein
MTANANTTAPKGKASPTSSQRLSRSAAVYAGRYLRSLSAQRRMQLERDWHDPDFNASKAYARSTSHLPR